MNMTIVDARGQACPMPVVRARRAMDERIEAGARVRVLVDNEAACRNLEKMARGYGWACETREGEAGCYEVTLERRSASGNADDAIVGAGGGMGESARAVARGEATANAPFPDVRSEAAVSDAPLPDAQAVPAVPSSGLVVAIGTRSMGRGDEDLGRLLLKGFMFSLAQLDEPPESILLFNAGIELAMADSTSRADLEDIARRGTRVLVCGTCVQYHKREADVAVGEITHMMDIVERLSRARRLIQL